jgi:hypothetical protein
MNDRRFALSRWEHDHWNFVQVVRRKEFMWTRSLERASRYTTRIGARQARRRLGLGSSEAQVYDTEKLRW